MTTFLPCACSRSARCEPMKPAPPVIRQRFDSAINAHYAVARESDKSPYPMPLSLGLHLEKDVIHALIVDVHDGTIAVELSKPSIRDALDAIGDRINDVIAMGIASAQPVALPSDL